MRYRLIAIDLDGTLLDRKGQPSEANWRAIAAAQRAGAIVVPCTGRSWIESRAILADFPRSGADADEPVGVFVGGAAISHLDTGATLDISVIEPHLALRVVEHLAPGPEAVLVFRDANAVGHDYLVTGRGQMSPNTSWWFEFTGARSLVKPDASLDDMHHAMRVNIVTHTKRMEEVKHSLRAALGDEIVMQSFAAVQMPDPDETVHVLEVFAKGVDKWRGIEWIADRHAIGPEQVAVIGDEINDLAMFQSAGCAIAMANAIDPLKACARHVTLDCDHCGVAHAIDQLLAGRWG